MSSPEEKRIFTIGEVVYDIMFKQGQPVAAKPGGAMLNSAISLGRSGLPVSFTGTCGNDKTGELISAFLNENHVDTSFLHHEASQSIIALAFLDENNNASYSFYRGLNPPELPMLPSTGPLDILLFGSFYSISPPTMKAVLSLRKSAAEKGTLLFYDPNFRSSHLGELEKVKPFIRDHIGHSHIVRGSDEDFGIIFGTKTAESTWELPCFKNCSALIYTRSSYGVDLCTPRFCNHYPVPGITPLSTIGAGDSFNAGVIAAIFENNIGSMNIASCTPEQWEIIIAKGTRFATDVCMSYDNYIPWPELI